MPAGRPAALESFIVDVIEWLFPKEKGNSTLEILPFLTDGKPVSLYLDDELTTLQINPAMADMEDNFPILYLTENKYRGILKNSSGDIVHKFTIINNRIVK